MIEQPPAFDIHNIKDIINLLNDCRFPPIIERINNECLYWDKVKHLEIPKGITHEKLWKLIKLRRQQFRQLFIRPRNINFIIILPMRHKRGCIISI